MTPPSLDITLVAPVFNERENLAPLLDEIEAVLGPSGKSYEVIAIDDGSTDGSGDLLREKAKEKPYLKVIFFRRNYGQAAAFDAGFRHASGRVVVTLDADMQNDPRDILPMIAMLDQGYDFISGHRKNRHDDYIVRRLPSVIANAIIRFVTRSQIRDMGCSLKVYRREIADEIRLYGEMHRYISVIAEGLGARTGQMVVNHRPRTRGKSKYGLQRTFKVLLDLVTIWFIRGYQTKPIYVFGGAGLLQLLTAFVLAAYVLYEKLRFDIYVHRNPLFAVSMVLTVVGVQFFGMGLLAEIIVRTYFESQHKSSYLIGERLNLDPAARARPGPQ